MAINLINDYSAINVNFDKIYQTLNALIIGNNNNSIDISNFSSVYGASIHEMNGNLYEFLDKNKPAIIDPYTSLNIVNGTVYIMATPSGSTLNIAYTNTRPSWNNLLHGWYGTGSFTTSRYLPYTIWYRDDKVITVINRLQNQSHQGFIISEAYNEGAIDESITSLQEWEFDYVSGEIWAIIRYEKSDEVTTSTDFISSSGHTIVYDPSAQDTRSHLNGKDFYDAHLLRIIYVIAGTTGIAQIKTTQTGKFTSRVHMTIKIA